MRRVPSHAVGLSSYFDSCSPTRDSEAQHDVVGRGTPVTY